MPRENEKVKDIIKEIYIYIYKLKYERFTFPIRKNKIYENMARLKVCAHIMKR